MLMVFFFLKKTEKKKEDAGAESWAAVVRAGAWVRMQGVECARSSKAWKVRGYLYPALCSFLPPAAASRERSFPIGLGTLMVSCGRALRLSIAPLPLRRAKLYSHRSSLPPRKKVPTAQHHSSRIPFPRPHNTTELRAHIDRTRNVRFTRRKAVRPCRPHYSFHIPVAPPPAPPQPSHQTAADPIDPYTQRPALRPLLRSFALRIARLIHPLRLILARPRSRRRPPPRTARRTARRHRHHNKSRPRHQRQRARRRRRRRRARIPPLRRAHEARSYYTRSATTVLLRCKIPARRCAKNPPPIALARPR